jgi:hypothetical protein
MYEYVLARGALNETVALGSVKPLNCAFLFHNLLLSHVFAQNPCFADVPHATLRHVRKTSPRCRETRVAAQFAAS